MDYGEFIDRVQERAGLESRDEAIAITDAVLETLGERLYPHRTERDHLATQLPKELGEALTRRQNRFHYTLDEFYTRVCARADVGHSRVEALTRAVAGVLKESVSAGEVDHLLGTLPQEYRDVLEVPSEMAPRP